MKSGIKHNGGIRSLAHQVASHGRNGDSMLVHMQPREIAALQQMTGQPMTTNPDTGQPEAFNLWKVLAGISGVAASFIPGLQPFAPFLMTLGSGLASSGVADPGKPKLSDQDSQKLAKLQAQAQNEVKVPITQNIPSPAPTPGTGLPGVVPEAMGGRQQVNGYITPPQGFYAQGGQIMPHEGQVVVDAMAAVHGRHPRPGQAIEQFRQVFGDGELAHFLSEMGASGGQQPQAANSGGFLRGPGAGMDDSIEGTIDGQRDVRLSNGEYVFPADVVSALGDGSSDAGAKRLDQMRDHIRQAKTGAVKQPGKIDPTQVLKVGLKNGR